MWQEGGDLEIACFNQVWADIEPERAQVATRTGRLRGDMFRNCDKGDEEKHSIRISNTRRSVNSHLITFGDMPPDQSMAFCRGSSTHSTRSRSTRMNTPTRGDSDGTV